MVTFLMPMCLYCKHKDPGELRCKAFPVRIPDEILRSNKFHDEPYPGDRGIRFEVIPGEEAEAEEQFELLRSSHK